MSPLAPAMPESLCPVPELAVIVPTYKEAGNVAALYRQLVLALAGVAFEIIFVDDDSPDGTADAVRRIAALDGRVRVVQRIGRRGLAGACTEGSLATCAPYVAVIDGDLQHDETALTKMLEALRCGHADLAIGTRYAPGGSIGEWTTERARISQLATRISRLIIRQSVSDPMSGFFMIRRELWNGCARRLSSIGFKILADLLATLGPSVRIVEIPYQFRQRVSGDSKLDTLVAWEYLQLVADKTLGRWVPVRLLSFGVVGGSGVLMHLVVVGILLSYAGTPFTTAQTAATLVAMTSNFALNNVLTYSDRRLRGLRWLRGLLVFMLVCSIGAIGNVGVAGYLYNNDVSWMPAAIAGIAVGTIWNFVVSARYAWGLGRA